MKNCVQLDESDFSFYQFPLQKEGKKRFPLSNARKMKLYAYKQLEMRHPRFSNQDTYRIKLAKDKKTINAVVIDKERLTEYRYRFRGKKLVAKNGINFSPASRVPKRKLIFLFCLVMCFIIMATLLFNSQKKTEDSITADTLEPIDLMEIVNEVNEENEENEPLNEIRTFFERLVQESVGNKSVSKISLTEIHEQTSESFLSVEIVCSGFYPEEFTDVIPSSTSSISPVEYREGVPTFTLRSMFGFTRTKKESDYVSQDGFMDALRKTVVDSGGSLLQEIPDKDVAMFTMPIEKLNNLGIYMKDFCQSKNTSICGFDCSIQENACVLQMGFSEDGITTLIFDYLSGIQFPPTKFSDDGSKEIAVPSDMDVENREKGAMDKALQGIETGRIKTSDGSVLVFYRMEDGKIKYMLEEY